MSLAGAEQAKSSKAERAGNEEKLWRTNMHPFLLFNRAKETIV